MGVMKDKSLTIIAIGLVCAVLFPQIGACVKYQDQRAKIRQQEEANAAYNHWMGQVEPMKELCIKKGGWPRIVPQGSSASWNWQVLCDFPSK